MKVRVFGKINLTLAVAKAQGRFHPIDSVVTSVDLFDTVEVLPAGKGEFSVEGGPIPPQSNTALVAARQFASRFGTGGVHVLLQKGIPIGAGLGGSSADAAAVVYCMCKLFGVDVASPEVHELCAELGSDVNFMLHGGLARMQGKGDDLTFGSLACPLHFALTLFGTQMSTAAVYAKLDEVEPNSKLPNYDGIVGPFEVFTLSGNALRNELTRQLLELCYTEDMLCGQCYNDLEAATQAMSGYASKYLDYANAKGYKCTMTGSGSAYYVLFTSRKSAAKAARTISAKGFDTIVCTSVPAGIEEL